MEEKELIKKDVERFSPNESGLNHEQVQSRINDKLVNKTTIAVGKSYWEIIRTNVFSLFNIMLYFIAALMIFAQHYTGLFFLAILIPNILIGLYEDLTARRLLSKLRLLTAPKAIVVRDGERKTIQTNEIVLDDVMVLTHDMQICADGIVVSGSILVNESLLTGESVNIPKQKGDVVYSGSYVVSGEAYVLADKVGRDTYLESLQRKANSFRRSPSEILNALSKLFRVVTIVVLVFMTTMITVHAIRGNFATFGGAREAIKSIAGSMVAMIPSGLYLLTSLALATSVVTLAKKQAQIQDFYSVEMLARVNVLCVDKTGTITDGTMNVKQVTLLDQGYDQQEIAQIISNLLSATKDDNATAIGLKNYFTYEATSNGIVALPFNSDNKYSAATFAGNKTYVLGAAEFLNLGNKSGVIKRTEQYTSLGYRVLVLGVSDGRIIDNKLEGSVSAIALIIMQDHIKENAINTFKWFKDNGVAIKVISGDNAVTVSEIARQAGIDDANRYISLEGVSLEQVALIAENYTVFGRVTPEQKEVIIQSLKGNGNTVAMTGDGVNDILALKRADCSIAMASGSDAARNVSHIVLLDNDFDHLPDVVAEGRRVINNVQRTSSLFLNKTFFAMIVTFAFLIASLVLFNHREVMYPFSTNNLYLWESISLGVPAFFLTLEPKRDRIKGKFFANIFKKVIPAAIALVVSVLVVYLLFIFQYNNVIHTGVYPDVAEDMTKVLMTSEVARSMSVICFSLIALVVLFKTCAPYSKYRLFVCIAAAVINFGVLLGMYLYSHITGNANLLDINFNALTLVNYMQVLIITVLIVTIYLFVTYTIEVFKGEHDNDQAR